MVEDVYIIMILLLDNNNRLIGIIDFGDARIADEYSDFIYLLECIEKIR